MILFVISVCVQGDELNVVMRIGIFGDYCGILKDECFFWILKYFLKVGELDFFYDLMWDFVFILRFSLKYEFDYGVN